MAWAMGFYFLLPKAGWQAAGPAVNIFIITRDFFFYVDFASFPEIHCILKVIAKI